MSVEQDCLLVMLPGAGDDRVAWWRVADGRVTGHGDGRPPPPPAPRARVVLVVPGVDCTVRWLELRAHTTVQATAAARVLLAGKLAVDPDGVHVAVAAAGGDRWLAVAVDPARMDDWLGQARLLGLQPDCLVPAPLLLPLPDGDTPAATVVRGPRQWLARGADLAFAAEPALARQVLAGHRQVPLGEAGPAMSAAAARPPVDLLQGRYAPRDAAAGNGAGWRRAGRLAVAALVLALLSPALLSAAHHWQASRMEQQARRDAAATLPASHAGDPVPALRSRLAATRTASDFGSALAALLHATGQSPSISLDALSWSEGTLSATVEHAGGTGLQPLATALPAAGFRLVEHETSLQSGVAHTRVSLEPAP